MERGGGGGGWSRRRFLGAASAAYGYGVLPAGLRTLAGRDRGAGRAEPYAAPDRGLDDERRHPLRLAPELAPSGITLSAAPGEADVGGGVLAPGWLIEGSLPSPLLRVRKGDPFEVRLANGLPEPLILHWHGLTPPEAADGHPRLAVPGGGVYDYRFTVENRAGTYWYHSHAHGRVARHTQAGIAGMILVHDDEEAALGLPSGDREVALVLQDRRVDPQGIPRYEVPDFMEGHHGEEPFGNGVRRPYLEVDSALYRFRLLNGSNARIFRLALDGRPLVLIGNDGGLLEAPVSLEWLDLAPGERADVLVDLTSLAGGERATLRSIPFSVSGFIQEVSGNNPHALEMGLLELRGSGRRDGPPSIPRALVPLPEATPDPADAEHRRTFRFTFERDPFSRTMEQHHINGVGYEMDRVDVRVPFGRTEIWTFTNDAWFAHPVHLHGTHFRVLSRTGGRGEVMAWEAGLKDTVLLHPGETVEVAVRFGAHPGLFLLHCHNLEHEDLGMMLNVMVE